jgi:hypothetical protein
MPPPSALGCRVVEETLNAAARENGFTTIT